jgi:hypothetical protein
MGLALILVLLASHGLTPFFDPWYGRSISSVISGYTLAALVNDLIDQTVLLGLLS